MSKELKIDPKMVEEILKFSRHVTEAPKLVSAPDEISLETTDHDVAYEEDKVRLLHYKPLSEKQHHTPLVIAYALINRYAVAMKFFTLLGCSAVYVVAKVPPVQYPCNVTLSDCDSCFTNSIQLSMYPFT